MHWWIKGDGCDLIEGLGESVSGVWSGDVDLNTGDVQRAYEEYRSKLELVSKIGLGSRQGRAMISEDLNKVYSQLRNDKEFIIKGKVYTVEPLLIATSNVWPPCL